MKHDIFRGFILGLLCLGILSIGVYSSGVVGCGGGGGDGDGGGGGGSGAAASAEAIAANTAMQTATAGVVAALSRSIQASSSLSTIITDGDFDCTTESDTVVNCSCPRGGSRTVTFDPSFLVECTTPGEVPFDVTITDEFDDCAASVCCERTTINGQFSANMTGTVSCPADAFPTTTFSIDLKTADQCSGLTLSNTEGSVDLGFDYNVSGSVTLFSSPTTVVSGEVCIGDAVKTFETFEEAKNAFDPDEDCDAAEQASCDSGPRKIPCPPPLSGATCTEFLAESSCKNGFCSQCNGDSDCGSNVCILGICERCRTDDDCVDNFSGPKCVNTDCGECASDADCTSSPNGPICDFRGCVECKSDADCESSPVGPICNSNGACIAAECGNSQCEKTETRGNCPDDCSVCGDGICDGKETEAKCPDDCICGDGICTGGETKSSCPVDCDACGNGTCEPEIGENSSTCEEDCPLGFCGDGRCDKGFSGGFEDSITCPADCGPFEPDGGFVICTEECGCSGTTSIVFKFIDVMCSAIAACHLEDLPDFSCTGCGIDLIGLAGLAGEFGFPDAGEDLLTVNASDANDTFDGAKATKCIEDFRALSCEAIDAGFTPEEDFSAVGTFVPDGAESCEGVFVDAM